MFIKIDISMQTNVIIFWIVINSLIVCSKQQCTDPNCVDCSSSTNYCNTCNSGKLPDSKRQCLCTLLDDNNSCIKCISSYVIEINSHSC